MDIANDEIIKRQDVGIVFGNGDVEGDPWQLLEESSLRLSGTEIPLGNIAGHGGTLHRENWQTARNAVLFTAGINSIAHLVLAINGYDISDIIDNFMIDSVNSLEDLNDENLEKVLAQCFAAIEKVNNRMVSVILEHYDSLEENQRFLEL
jgi:hypothetical protein